MTRATGSEMVPCLLGDLSVKTTFYETITINKFKALSTTYAS